MVSYELTVSNHQKHSYCNIKLQNNQFFYLYILVILISHKNTLVLLHVKKCVFRSTFLLQHKLQNNQNTTWIMIYYIFGNLKLYCCLEKTIFRSTFLLSNIASIKPLSNIASIKPKWKHGVYTSNITWSHSIECNEKTIFRSTF